MQVVTDLPTIYCINLASRPDRRAQMQRRFELHGIADKVVFVDAVSKNDSLINYYQDVEDTSTMVSMRAAVGCFASHLKAIKLFVASNQDKAIICEDDVLLRTGFKKLFLQQASHLPTGFRLCMLSYIVCDWTKVKFAGNPYICSTDTDNTWGTQMYLIGAGYARKVVELYDKPGFGVSTHINDKTSEMITRKANGYLVNPILAVEDCTDSDIRDQQNMESHHRVFKQWDFDNFNLGL